MQINLYEEGEKTPYHQQVHSCPRTVFLNISHYIIHRSWIGTSLAY
jgi:hypothetical protein